MQSFISTLGGSDFSRQTGLTHHRRSTHVCLNPKSGTLSMSDGLHYELADDIPQFDPDTPSQLPEMEICPNAGAPINDTVRVHSSEDDDWDPLAPFATPHQWQLCRSIVDTNLGKPKLNNILKPRLIVPDANAKIPDQLYRRIADMEEMDRLVCGWEQSSLNIEEKATPFWYWNPIAAVQHLLGHPPHKDHLSYTPVKQMDSNGKCIYTEMWTTDWWGKTQATFLELSERLFLVRFSLCLGELECQRDHVRESMSERACQIERVRKIVSERLCQRDCVREIMSERLCQRELSREHVRERVSEHVREHVREHQSHIVRDSVSESVAEIACRFHPVRADSVWRVSAPVLAGFIWIWGHHYSLLTHPRNLCQMDQRLSLLYLAVTKLCSLL